jgi:hypothetical protein
MLALLALPALAQSTVELHQGPTLLQPCLDTPDCTELVAVPLSEALTEIGYGLHHEGVGTSALGARGTGVVTEVALGTMPLGEGNDIQQTFPAVPLLPRLSVGGLYAAGSREAPGPQLAAAVHGLPTLRMGEASTWAFGASASAAVPIERRVLVGGGLSWTHAGFSVPLIDSVGDLRQLEGLEEYVEQGRVLCEEPCLDKMVQHTASARVGASVEPLPWLLAYLQTGILTQSERFHIALDRSVWRLAPVMLEASAGAGVRVDDVWQVTLGATTASRPAGASTEGRGMTRLVMATSLRLGPRRP